MKAQDITSDDALKRIERAERIGSLDGYRGERAERVADVSLELEAATALALVVIAAALEDLRRHGSGEAERAHAIHVERDGDLPASCPVCARESE